MLNLCLHCSGREGGDWEAGRGEERQGISGFLGPGSREERRGLRKGRDAVWQAKGQRKRVTEKD